MILSVASPHPPRPFLLSPSSSVPFLRPPHASLRAWDTTSKRMMWKSSDNILYKGGRMSTGVCRAELVNDAPFAAAIGACVLNSLLFPISSGEPEDEDEGGPIDGSDVRFAVMGIISFIPYFNWLSWVFAWMDSGRKRYLVYSIVYLAPYFRTNLSLSPEESWLPIAAIFVCILHIQLEVSIDNGDVKDIQFFGKALRHLNKKIRNREIEYHQERSKRNMKLPSSHELRDKVREWGIPREQTEDVDADEKK